MPDAEGINPGDGCQTPRGLTLALAACRRQQGRTHAVIYQTSKEGLAERTERHQTSWIATDADPECKPRARRIEDSFEPTQQSSIIFLLLKRALHWRSTLAVRPKVNENEDQSLTSLICPLSKSARLVRWDLLLDPPGCTPTLVTIVPRSHGPE